MGLDSVDHRVIGQSDISRHFLDPGHSRDVPSTWNWAHFRNDPSYPGKIMERNQSMFMMVVVVHWTMQCLILSHKGHLRLDTRFPRFAQTRNRSEEENDVTLE